MTTTGCSEPGGRVGQRVQRGNSQPDEVRRRREVRLVGDAAARVVAHRPRTQPGAQVRARSRAARSSPATTTVGRRTSRSASAAITYGRSDCETNADPPSSARRAAAGSLSMWLRNVRRPVRVKPSRVIYEGPGRRQHVQAHVVDDRLAQLGQHRVDEGVAASSRRAARGATPSITVPRYSRGSSGVTRTGAPRPHVEEAEPLQPRLGVAPATGSSTARASRRGRVWRHARRSPALDGRDVARAAALRDEAAAGLERARAGGRTARRGRRSSGTWRSRGSRRPARSSSSSSRSATNTSTRSPSRSRACSTIAGEPSTATTWPRGSRSTSAAVTRPVPQPASSTARHRRSSSRSSTSRPIASSGAETCS